MTATVKIYDIASKVHTKGFQVSISWYGLTLSLLFTVVYYLDRVLNLFLLQRQEYECSVAELLTAIDWDKKDRGVGFWNDTMVFYQVLLEKLEVEMEVTVNVNEL